MKILFLVLTFLLFEVSAFPQAVYHFDTTAKIIGCGRAAFQKISNDWRYELTVEVLIDSVPKYRDLNVIKYSKFLKLFFIKYPNENNYVRQICTDVIYLDKHPKKPDIYQATQGTIEISKLDEKTFYITVNLKDVVFKNSSNQEINLPLEVFENILIGWKAG